MISIRTLSLAGLLLLAAACASAPPEGLVAPPLELTLVHRPGGVLAGATRLPEVPESADVWSLRARAFVLASGSSATWLDRAPGVSRSAALLLQPADPDPIRGVVPGVTGLRALAGGEASAFAGELAAALDDPTRGLEFTSLAGTLAPGTVTELRALASDGGAWVLAIDRAGSSGDGGRVALAHRVAGLEDGRVLLQAPVGPTSGPVWVELPRRGARAIGLLVDFGSGDAGGAAHAEAVEASWEEVRAHADRLTLETSRWTAGDAGRAVRVAAGVALAQPETRREALGMLIDTTPGVARDLLDTASDEVLETWAARLAERVDWGGTSAAASAWAAERAALEWLARRADRGEADLEQEGLLTRHLGEMGRFPLDVVRFLAGCGNRATFDAWVLRENRRLLASPDPAARIRALDWLTVRGEAPAEFDPFATRSERRDQLRADEEVRRAASEGADANPNTAPDAAGKEPR